MFSKEKIRFYNRIDIKLTIWHTLTLLTIITIVFGFLDYRLRHNILKGIDRMLVDEAHEIINEALEDPTNMTDQLKEFEETVTKRKFYGIAFRILDNRGNPLCTYPKIRGITFPFAKSPLNPTGHKTFTSNNVEVPHKSNPFRLCTYYHMEGDEVKFIVQVATYLRMMKKTITNFRRNLISAFFLALFFGSLGGWLLSRRSLRPIHKINDTTRRITVANLNERLPLQGTGDELDRLALTINQMIERLGESFQKLTQFTADAAHELRTPIAALKGEIEVLLSRRRSLKEYRQAMSNNLERLDFLTRLVNNLLLLSQADEGRENLQIETIKLNELLYELWEAFNLVAAQKNILFTLADSEEISIMGDMIKLKQLFSNLIDNAIKYTPKGGNMNLSIQPDTDRVKITLEDSGIGIPPDDLPLIFDRFYRADKSRSRQSGGTGLGLSICRWIVKTHHGTITAESQVRQGSTFTVILPLKLA